MKESFSLSQLDMNLLVVFDILMKEQSLTRTAEKLNLTTPAVSSAVKRLQLLLKDPVVIRQGREMKPTTAALQLQEQLAPGFEIIRDALRFFNDSPYPQRVVLGVPPCFDAIILPSLFKAFPETDKTQLITRELRTLDSDSIEQNLVSQTFDMVITLNEVNHHNLVCEPLGEDQLVLIYRRGHPFFAHHSVAKSNIEEARHAAFEVKVSGISAYDYLIPAKNQLDTIACYVTSPLAAYQIVSTSDMVSIMPDLFTRNIETFVENKESIDWQPIPYFKPKIGYYLVFPKRYAEHPGIGEVKRVLRKTLSDAG